MWYRLEKCRCLTRFNAIEPLLFNIIQEQRVGIHTKIQIHINWLTLTRERNEEKTHTVFISYANSSFFSRLSRSEYSTFFFFCVNQIENNGKNPLLICAIRIFFHHLH